MDCFLNNICNPTIDGELAFGFLKLEIHEDYFLLELELGDNENIIV